MDWKRVRLDEIERQPDVDHPGASAAFLGEDMETGPWLLHVRLEAGTSIPAHWHTSDTIYVITMGEMSVGDEGAYRTGDVRWVRAGTFYGPEVAGADGCELLLISSGGPPGAEFDRSTARLIGSVSGDT